MSSIERLRKDYPWIQTPLVVGAPMRLIALAPLAVEVSKAGGIGFIGAGTDVSDLEKHLQEVITLLKDCKTLPSSSGTLPIGIGFINWGASRPTAIPLIQQYRPAAVWFFAPKATKDLASWTQETRQACPETKIWVQVGSVSEALSILKIVKPDVLVVQGTDAGGHGLAQGAGILSLFPEVDDAMRDLVAQNTSIPRPTLIAAGGIAEARGAAAAFTLGAAGVVLGTRFLAAREANIAKGYQNEVIRANDGGQTTTRTKVYDSLRGTIWADSHNARGLINKSYTDAHNGMEQEENKRLYTEEMKKGDDGWGVRGRMTTYAGTVVGLVKEVKGAGEIVQEVSNGAKAVLQRVKV